METVRTYECEKPGCRNGIDLLDSEYKNWVETGRDVECNIHQPKTLCPKCNSNSVYLRDEDNETYSRQCTSCGSHFGNYKTRIEAMNTLETERAHRCTRCGEYDRKMFHYCTTEETRPPMGFFKYNDEVNHPQHYTFGKFEVIDVIEDWKLNFHLGNAVKYIARCDHKGHKLKDLKKAKWYLERAIKELDGELEND